MNFSAFASLVIQAIGLVGRRTTIILLLVAVLLSVFDLVGIAAVYPFVQFIYLGDKSRFIPAALPEMLRLSPLGLNLLALFLFLALFAAKTAAQYWLIRLQSVRLANASAGMTERFLSAMLDARYSVFQRRPASQLAGICYSNPVHAGIVVLSLSQLVTEAIFVAAVTTLALVTNWRMTLVAVVLLAFFTLLLLNWILRPMQHLGRKQRLLEASRHNLLFAIASSVREIGVMGLADVFKFRSQAISSEIALVAGRFGMLTAVPRLSIELLFMVCVLALIVVLMSLDYPSEKAIPLMGMVLIGAIRMVPAVSRTLGALSNAKFSSGFVRDLVETRNMLDESVRPRTADHVQFQREIQLEDVEFRYDDHVILRGISLTIPKGAYVSIVGRSGEGKSTLLDLVIGLQPATAGSFTCDGQEFDPFSSQSFRKLIGYVPQSVSLFDESLAFNISLRENPDLNQLNRVLSAANLAEFVSGLPNGVQTNLGESGIRVSGGQRQRIGIARALYRDPEILVLDEATSSLDSVTETSLTDEIQKLRGQLTILLVAHRLSTVKTSDCIYVLADGRIAEKGTHAELLARGAIYSTLVASSLDTMGMDVVQA